MASTQKSLNIENEVIQACNTNNAYRQLLNDALGINTISAIKAEHTKVSSRWEQLTNKSGNEVSKSDILLKDANGQSHGVSWKNGPGRGTSANYNETRAILLTVIDSNTSHKNNTALVKSINELLTLWEPVSDKTRTDYDVTTTKLKNGLCRHTKLLDMVTVAKQLNVMIKGLVKEHPDFFIDVIRESLVGKNKFGNKPQSADFYVQCEKGNMNNLQLALSTSSKEFNSLCEKYLKKININMKSTSVNNKKDRLHWIRFDC